VEYLVYYCVWFFLVVVGVNINSLLINRTVVKITMGMIMSAS